MVASVALSSATTYAGVSDDVANDPLLNAVKNALAGGGTTRYYFETVNNMQQVYDQMSDKNAWIATTDTETGLAVYYLTANDDHGKAYFLTIRVKGVKQDANGNVVLNGSKVTIDGDDYHGIGAIHATSSWGDLPLSETCWCVGLAEGAALGVTWVFQLLNVAITSAKNAQSEAFLKLKARMEIQDGGRELEDGVNEEDDAANASMEAEFSADTASTADTLIIEEVAEAGLALGPVFFGAALVLAIVTVVLSFILHNSYHRVRIWNFTRYRMVWVIYFDNSQSMDQGQLVTGPVKFDKGDNKKIVEYVALDAIDSLPTPPDVKPPHTANFGDLHINSSHEYSGIGYVLQCQLQDPTTNKTVYTGTAYFDIPLSGKNSLGVTFEKVDDLQKYYDDNHGGNVNYVASASSSDNVVSGFSTYDFLEGTHVAPDGTSGQYYYQSLLVFGQNDFFNFSDDVEA